MPRIVLDAGARAGLAKHLEVEVGALPQALRLEQPARVFELLHAIHKLDLDVLDRLEELLARRHEVPRRVDVHLVSLREHLAGERVELRDPLDVVAKKLDAHGELFVRGLNLEGGAADAELAAHQIGVGALVLDVDEMPKDRVAANALAFVQADRHGAVVDRRAKTVDAGDRRDDDHVASLEQRPRRGVPHAVDLLVARAVLLDVGVAPGYVRLWLVVVVVRDEVLDGVLGEELLELAVQLRGQRLVVREYERGPLHLRDHVSDGVGFSATGHAQQRLMSKTVVDALDELGDRLRLISGG